MELTVIDGHNDSLGRLTPFTREQLLHFLNGDKAGHMDLPRARRGGLGASFFSVFVPPPPTAKERPCASFSSSPSRDVFGSTSVESMLPEPLDFSYASQTAISMVAGLFRLERFSDGRLKVVHTVEELDECLERGVLGAILHFEGAEPIDRDLNALEVFYRAGLRSLGLVWSRPNAFGCGVPFVWSHSPGVGPGLTDAGKELVRACNQLGIMLDVSHLNKKGFWDLAAVTEAPIVATHSCAYSLCPVPRNLTDKQLDAIKDSNGMVGVNFSVNLLSELGAKDPDLLGTLIRHIDYLVERVGIDRVGFGSDFDGTIVPDAVGDVTGFPKIIDALKRRGYDDDSLQKLAYKNWRRVLQKTWSH